MTKAETNVNKCLRTCFKPDAQCEVYAGSLGISYSTLSALRIILEHDGGCTRKTICGYTFLPKQVVNTIVTALLHHRVIRVIELDFDRRHKMVHPADKRRASVLEVIQEMKNAKSRTTENLDENQKETMLTAAKLHMARFYGCLLE